MFLGIQFSYAQTSNPSRENLLPAYAEKYNKSPLGENVFVFDHGMEMKEIQVLILGILTINPFSSIAIKGFSRIMGVSLTVV